MALVGFQAIRISLPTSRNEQLEQQVIDLIRASDPIGRVGNYSGIYERTKNLEGFTSIMHPNQQAAGIMLTTYAPQDLAPEQMREFLSQVQTLHPWQHPVIEVQQILLFLPDSGSSGGLRKRQVEEAPASSAPANTEFDDWD